MALRMIKLCSTEAVPHIGSAVHYLKENGLWTLAGRLRKLSKKRNFTAHPDVGFLQDLEAGLAPLQAAQVFGETYLANHLGEKTQVITEQETTAETDDSDKDQT